MRVNRTGPPRPLIHVQLAVLLYRLTGYEAELLPSGHPIFQSKAFFEAVLAIYVTVVSISALAFVVS